MSFGGTPVEDKEKYDENNKKDKIKYVDVGEIAAPFENRCQPMIDIDDKFKEDATKFADDTLRRLVVYSNKYIYHFLYSRFLKSLSPDCLG